MPRKRGEIASHNHKKSRLPCASTLFWDMRARSTPAPMLARGGGGTRKPDRGRFAKAGVRCILSVGVAGGESLVEVVERLVELQELVAAGKSTKLGGASIFMANVDEDYQESGPGSNRTKWGGKTDWSGKLTKLVVFLMIVNLKSGLNLIEQSLGSQFHSVNNVRNQTIHLLQKSPTTPVNPWACHTHVALENLMRIKK